MDTLVRNRQYNEYIKAKEPKTKNFPSLIWAFLIGGSICAFGQGIFDLTKLINPAITDLEATSWMLIVIMFITILLTGIGIFDKIGAVAGAGTVIPISGFANSIASPAIEFKKEGIIFGLCVKMFVVAGPVIVSGIVSSVIVGLVYIFF